MLERTAVLSFKNSEGKNYNLTLKDVKEEVQEADVITLMDSIISKKLIKSGDVELITKNTAQIVTKETNEIDLE